MRLSYCIDEKTPLYPGTQPLQFSRNRRIESGDSCNTFSITVSDHSGTHIDMPKHFLNSGMGIKDCPPHKLICKNPFVIDCPKQAGEIIEARDLERSMVDRRTDALLIRTGFYRKRSSDIAAYCNNNPSFSAEAAGWIRQNLLNLNLVGIDTISISSKANRNEGAQSHRILLTDRGYGGDPVLILEDLYLPAEFKKLDELFVFPIFSADIDSSPCTVIGVIYD